MIYEDYYDLHSLKISIDNKLFIRVKMLAKINKH